MRYSLRFPVCSGSTFKPFCGDVLSLEAKMTKRGWWLTPGGRNVGGIFLSLGILSLPPRSHHHVNTLGNLLAAFTNRKQMHQPGAPALL